MYVRVCKRDASQLYAFFHCNLLSRDGKAKRERARKIGVASPFSFWRKAQSGAVRKERRAREKRNRWTKSSRLLISNVSDYVGLGSLRFFIQTKEKRGGGAEREERERQTAWLATTWLSNSSSVIVYFVHLSVSRMFSSRFSSCHSPLRDLVRFLLFYTISYFTVSEEQDGATTILTFRTFEERIRDYVQFPGVRNARDRVGPLIFAVRQNVHHWSSLSHGRQRWDSDENLSEFYCSASR